MFSGTTYGDISPRVGIFAVAEFLAYADTQIIFDKFAKLQPVPKNKGLQIRFRRPVPFEVNPTQLVEGVTPAPQALEYEDVATALAQYGAWVPYTDVITDTHEDPNLQVMTELCGKQAAEIKELITWNEIRGGTQVVFSGAAANRSQVQARPALDNLRNIVRSLKRNHCKKITKILKASTNIATEPVNASYVMVAHTDTESEWRSFSTFVPIEKYASGSPLHANEIGKVEDIRIILSPMLEPFIGAGSATIAGVLNNGTNVNVYPCLIFGEDAFAVTPLKGMDSANIAVKNPTMGQSYEDPLGQRGFVAWKIWFSAVRLNEQWLSRFETAVGAL